MSDSNRALVKVGATAITVRENDLGKPTERLVAQLIDGAAYTGVGLAGYITWGVVGMASPFLGAIAGMSIPLAFMGYQWYLLSEKGQTVGKQVMGLKIVDAESGGNPGFVKTVVMRNWITKALCALPVYPLLNAAPIFWNPRRCLHDYIAGTVVVKDGSDAAKGGAADPADQLDILLAKMEEDMLATRNSLVEAKVQLKKAQNKLETLKAEAAKLESDARTTVQRGNDELARKILVAQRLKVDEVNTQQKHCEDLARAVGQLEATVDSMAKQFAAAKGKKGSLGSRRALLEAGTAFKTFDDEVNRIQDKVGDAEIHMEVETELARAKAGPEEEPLAAMPALDPIEDELAQLKRELEEKKK
jgi:phage shock protein A